MLSIQNDNFFLFEILQKRLDESSIFLMILKGAEL